MALEQKGCQQSSFGAKNQLFINKLLTEDCKTRHRSLSMAWVDYQRAYDSVPHIRLLRCLQLHKISPVLCSFLSPPMKSWRTSMVLSYGNVNCHQGEVLSKVIHYFVFSSVWFLTPSARIYAELVYGYWMSTGRGETSKR